MSRTLLALDDALTRIAALEALAGRERIALRAGSGASLVRRMVLEDVCAAHAVPPFACSAVDGFALSGDNLAAGTDLRMTQYLPAGASPESLRAGTTAEVFTGAAVPEGTAAIVMRENTLRNKDVVRVQTAIRRGAHLRKPGEDFAAGAVVVSAGQRLNARRLAALAIAGVDELILSKPLRIGLYSSGDELCEPGQILESGKIHDGNRPGLFALLSGFGDTVVDLGIVPDREAVVADFLNEHSRHFDLLVGSAGMSESATDWTARYMAMQGEVVFWQLAIKPARPVGLLRLRHQEHVCYLLGLPGNAASCLIAGWLLGYPLLDRLHGGQASLPEAQWLRAGFAMDKKPHRREFVRVRLEHTRQGTVAHRALPAGSASLSSLLCANGLLDLPQEQTRLEAGALAAFLPFPRL